MMETIIGLVMVFAGLAGVCASWAVVLPKLADTSPDNAFVPVFATMIVGLTGSAVFMVGIGVAAQGVMGQ